MSTFGLFNSSLSYRTSSYGQREKNDNQLLPECLVIHRCYEEKLNPNYSSTSLDLSNFVVDVVYLLMFFAWDHYLYCNFFPNLVNI